MTTLHPTVPPGLVMAFYKGTRTGFHGIVNRAGRLIDNGPYSHSELIMSNGMSWSSSLEDGGVRTKAIGYSSVGNWDFLPIPDPDGSIEAGAREWYLAHVGLKYDLLGNVRFCCGIVRDSPDKWFCTESNVAALGIPEAFRFGPNGAAAILPRVFGGKMITVPRPPQDD